MKVYLETKEDWINFVNGRNTMARTVEIEGYYKSILVSPIEIVGDINKETNMIVINKKH